MIELAIAIPTYKRAHLLNLLLQDLAAQSVQPDVIVVVDGDPTSGEVLRMLKAGVSGLFARPPAIRYVPSNHGNLAYQRYLGWRVAVDANVKLLLYLDDDLRISNPASISLLLQPLQNEEDTIVGCTGTVLYPEDRETDAPAAVRDRARLGSSKTTLLVKLLGSSRRQVPGSLSPSGHRCPPVVSDTGTAGVQWLRGGVMACRMAFLKEDCFSEDLFALSELGYGHGEDTLLSRRLAARGKLLFVSGAHFQHPCADTPQAYATRACKMGYGAAYSRRLLNDNFRWPARASLADRVALVKSYLGNSLLGWGRALRSPRLHRFEYAWGYTLGAIKGVLLPPSSARLTPKIDWRKDAESALRVSPH